MRVVAGLLVCGVVLSPAVHGAELRITEGTNLSIDVSPGDGSIAMDLLGSLWRVPASGGEATRLTDSRLPARRPRFAPDGSTLLYQTDAPDGPQLWRFDLDSGETQRISRSGEYDQQGNWHPDGERIVFASQRRGTGLDLWEADIATGLQWRLTEQQGDEYAPAWSANGRHLAYLRHAGSRWHLMVRRYGRAAQSVLESETPLYVPAWRPDGTLITYLREEEDGRLDLKMLILSEPPLQRSLASNEDFFVAPVSWLDRDRFYYTADGAIKSRRFGAWSSTRRRFSAAVSLPDTPSATTRPARELPQPAPPGNDFVIRAARLYDGIDSQYRRSADIVIRDGVIERIEDQREHSDLTVFDIGDVTVLPGLIDVYSPMPDGPPAQSGPRTLAFGVTTLLTPDAGVDVDATAWDGAETPGPRLLAAVPAAGTPPVDLAPRVRLAVIDNAGPAGNGVLRGLRQWREAGVPVLAQNWRVGLGLGADLLLGAAALPASPRGFRYQDVAVIGNSGPLALVSGLADGRTAGLDALRASRQAATLPAAALTSQRTADTAAFERGDAAVVLGSRPSGLPAGFSTQAEMRALSAAGLAPAEVLHAATGGAAAALGLPGDIGRIAPGARADLLLVSGDPLGDIDDALNVVAVVRNGRFYSLSNLLERVDVD